MINSSKTRRETIKLLALSGFGLMIPSCITSNSDNDSDDLVLKEIKDSIRNQNNNAEEIERKLASSNVVFLTQEDSDFEKLNEGFNLNIKKTPKIIALPNNTDGVQEAVKYANRMGLKIAVKSGGHSFEGFSSIEGGLMINLSLMKSLEWNSNHQLKAQPGVLLKELYEFTLPKKRILPAGSCGTVGLAGLALGGGYGFFSRKYGLTCDHIKEATLVDGLGNIHKVYENDELMWALKGGGNGNFGIVTEFLFQTHPAPESFTRYRFQAFNLDIERAKDLMKTWFETTENLPESCFAAFVLNGTTLTLLLTRYEEESEIIRNFVSVFIELMDKVSSVDTKSPEKALPTYYGTQHPIYFKNSSAGYYQNYSSIENCIDEIIPLVFDNKLIYQINTLGGNINLEKFEANSCYPHRNQKYLCELQSYWKKDSEKTNKLNAFKQIQDILYQNGIDKQYRNYPNIDFPNWEKAYYGKNYSKLQNIKLKFDSENTIQHEQSIRLNLQS